MRRISDSDSVNVLARGWARLRKRTGEFIAGQSWDDERSVVEVKGWVRALLRERGKIVSGSRREEKISQPMGTIVAERLGHNIWTDTGREYDAMLKSYQSPGVALRNDRISYIGVGVGAQVEDSGVTSLVTPVEYLPGAFLAPLDVPPTFPLTPTRTTVRYHRIFEEAEISLSSGVTVPVSEFGLFTDGRQSDYAVGLRDLTIANATRQSPVAYKAIEPLGKKLDFQLEVFWELRH